MPDHLEEVIKRVVAGSRNEADIQAIAAAFQSRQLSLVTGSRAAGIAGDATNAIVITGDNNLIVQGQVAQSLQAILERFNSQKAAVTSVDELVQQVRSLLHNDIQRLHGIMPLWGVDHWVPLGELFVDVNILEELSSSHRAELDDLWQDFSKNPNYWSLDRIGLGRKRERVSGLEVLKRNTNLMVVGKPGSGKTTYLQRVATECNAGNLQAHRIPVLIKLREFVEDGKSLSYSLERYLERCWKLTEAETQLMLNQGRSLVLLDGLDEVTGADGQVIAKQIKRFARDYPQVQVIVTCRTQSQESRFERFDYVEVADFNELQVRTFAEQWFQTVCVDPTVGKAKATAFLDQLFREENEAIRELAITPILLSLTCAVFQQTGKFYSKRSKLYEEGLELLLEQWDKSREIERDEIYRDLSVERKLELLSHLAVKKFEQEQYVLFEQAEIEGYIAEFLQVGQRDSRAVLRTIEAQHGLLIERSQKVWSFSHLTFQEYLVAKHFIACKDWDSLAKQITNPHQWYQVYLLTFNTINEESSHSLLILLKQKLDSLSKKDEKLQSFMKWVENKVKIVPNKLCEEVVLRALYFELELNRNFIVDLGVDISRMFGILNPYAEFRFNLADKLNNSTNYISEFMLDNHLCQSLFFNPAINPHLAEELELPIGAYNNFHHALWLAANVDAELQSQLQALSAQFPDVWTESVDLWWKEQGHSWTEQLRKLATKHRNIGYNWQFSDEQRKLFQLYHAAIELLIDCLNTENVSLVTRNEIRETLFLSIAEIEKRKREKVE